MAGLRQFAVRVSRRVRRQTGYPTSFKGPTVEVRSAAIRELVAPDVRVERLATGFEFTEGPVWHPDGFLRFSDIPGNTRWRWDTEGGATVDCRPSSKGNGMTYDAELRLIVCEHLTSRVTRDGEVIASRYEGRGLNSPNDVVVAHDGSIVFTDPDFGRTVERFGARRPLELDFRGVYRLPPEGGEPELLARDFTGQPNGLCFSPDERLLYVVDSQECLLRVFDWDGIRATNGRLFFAPITTGDRAHGVPDGVKCDERGNVWVTGPFGIWVISAAGEHLGVVRMPERPSNLNWAGTGWNELVVTATTSVYRLSVLVAGAKASYMR